MQMSDYRPSRSADQNRRDRKDSSSERAGLEYNVNKPNAFGGGGRRVWVHNVVFSYKAA